MASSSKNEWDRQEAKDKNNRNNRQELFSFATRNCVFLEALEFTEHECGECDQKITRSNKGKKKHKKMSTDEDKRKK